MPASAARSASGFIDISAARAKDTRRSRPASGIGDRYNKRGAYAHGAGLAHPPRKKAVDTTVCAVADPFDPGKRLLATVNRRVDLLELERSHGRIEVSQYEVGRQVQAIFERASGARLGSGGWNVTSSRDQTVAHELSVIYAIEDARLVTKLMDRVVEAVGTPGARFLHQLLTGRKGFSEIAADRGKGGERGASQVASHFRILLEYLDEAFAAEGIEAQLIRATRDIGETAETDEQGRVVPAGHGHSWGSEESRYAPHMNDQTFMLRGRSAKVRDRVGARHRVAVDEVA